MRAYDDHTTPADLFSCSSAMLFLAMSDRCHGVSSLTRKRELTPHGESRLNERTLHCNFRVPHLCSWLAEPSCCRRLPGSARHAAKRRRLKSRRNAIRLAMPTPMSASEAGSGTADVSIDALTVPSAPPV